MLQHLVMRTRYLRGRRFGLVYRGLSAGFCVGVRGWRRGRLCVCGSGVPALCQFGFMQPSLHIWLLTLINRVLSIF